MELTVRKLAEDFQCEVLSGEKGMDTFIEMTQLSRPGIELAGLFDFYENDRVQLFGSKEVTFFWWLNEQDQSIRTRMLFEKKPPVFLFSSHAEVPNIFIELGNEFSVPVLKSPLRTTELASKLYRYLFAKLAPRMSIHGTLLDINGVGVLIQGSSGIGKSEVALELVRRGHQLVADDRVDLFEREKNHLVGEAPEILKKYIEIRGIGIINIVKLFGASAFKEEKNVNLIVELVHWDDHLDYDRIGITQQKKTFFDSQVVYVKIPITAARSVPTLIEVAAMNTTLHELGTNMAKEFTDQLNEIIKKNTKK